MAGTDHAKATETGPQPAFVLVAPQMGENIGAAARAMWNFSLDRMRLVAPRDGWPNPRAEAMASGAGRVLDRAALAATTAEACADLTYVFATTARDRAMTKLVLTPEAAMREARAMTAAGERVGVLFGPERAGLETADIVRANAVISVPVNPAYGSLNLAQCVLLIAYEWQRAAGAAAGRRLPHRRRAAGDRDRGRPLPRAPRRAARRRRLLLPRGEAGEHDRQPRQPLPPRAADRRRHPHAARRGPRARGQGTGAEVNRSRADNPLASPAAPRLDRSRSRRRRWPDPAAFSKKWARRPRSPRRSPRHRVARKAAAASWSGSRSSSR